MTNTNTNFDRQSDSNRSFHSSIQQSNILKRLMLFSMMAIFLVFAGFQTTPATQASETCTLVCGEPFIDPNDGRCYQMCCPTDEECKRPCELRPCVK